MPKFQLARGGAILIALALSAGPAAAQSDTGNVHTSGNPAYTSTSDLSDVRLFESWVADAVFTPGVDLEPFFDWSTRDNNRAFVGGEAWMLGTRVAMWVHEGIEVGGRIGIAGLDIDGPAEGESGLADIAVHARYRVPLSFAGTFAVGGEAQLPTGDREAGQDNGILRIFGALRQDLGAFTFAANLGFEYADLPGDDANGISVGLGSLIPVTDDIAGIFELNLRTAYDYTVFSGGIDYELPPGGHLRGALGFGLDDEAPDVALHIALCLPVF